MRFGCFCSKFVGELTQPCNSAVVSSVRFKIKQTFHCGPPISTFHWSLGWCFSAGCPGLIPFAFTKRGVGPDLLCDFCILHGGSPHCKVLQALLGCRSVCMTRAKVSRGPSPENKGEVGKTHLRPAPPEVHIASLRP